MLPAVRYLPDRFKDSRTDNIAISVGSAIQIRLTIERQSERGITMRTIWRQGIFIFSFQLLFGAAMISVYAKSPEKSSINTLTEQEKQEGWELLFDGENLDQWTRTDGKEVPKGAWRVVDGELRIVDRMKRLLRGGGSIYTKEQYSDFEFTLEYNISENANSGIKYFVQTGTALGLEYQIISGNPGLRDYQYTASLYDLIPATGAQPKPPGEWNHVRIVVRGKHCEHWLNGSKVVEFERGGDHFRAQVAKSKFAHEENFGEFPRGHIMLQDHGGGISFRNIKIRKL